jgi:hypothetical protein
MQARTFKDTYEPGTQYGPTGALINKQAAALNSLISEQPERFITKTSGIISSENFPAPMQVITGVVADASDDNCNSRETSVGGFSTTIDPCRTASRYSVYARWFEWSTDSWQTQFNLLPMDASGFWEPDESDASWREAYGEALGHIPTFRKGDTVNAYWDAQRGTLIPLAGVFQNQPMGEWGSHQDETIAVIEPGTGWGSSAGVYIFVDVQEESDVSYRSFAVMAFEVPSVLTDNVIGTRSTSINFRAFNNSKVRLRAVNATKRNNSDGVEKAYDVKCIFKRLKVYGVGRYSSANTAELTADRIERSYQYTGADGEQLTTDWQKYNQIEGRFKDSPAFNMDASGEVNISFLDPNDAWIIGVDADITIEITGELSYSCCEVVCDVVADADGHLVYYGLTDVCSLIPSTMTAEHWLYITQSCVCESYPYNSNRGPLQESTSSQSASSYSNLSDVFSSQSVSSEGYSPSSQSESSVGYSSSSSIGFSSESCLSEESSSSQSFVSSLSSFGYSESSSLGYTSSSSPSSISGISSTMSISSPSSLGYTSSSSPSSLGYSPSSVGYSSSSSLGYSPSSQSESSVGYSSSSSLGYSTSSSLGYTSSSSPSSISGISSTMSISSPSSLGYSESSPSSVSSPSSTSSMSLSSQSESSLGYSESSPSSPSSLGYSPSSQSESSLGYSPSSEGYSPSSQSESSEGYSPSSQSESSIGYSSSSRGYSSYSSPSSLGYSPSSEGYSPSSEGYSESSLGYSPSSLGYSPSSEGYSPSSQSESSLGYSPSSEGYSPSSQSESSEGYSSSSMSLSSECSSQSVQEGECAACENGLAPEQILLILTNVSDLNLCDNCEDPFLNSPRILEWQGGGGGACFYGGTFEGTLEGGGGTVGFDITVEISDVPLGPDRFDYLPCTWSQDYFILIELNKHIDGFGCENVDNIQGDEFSRVYWGVCSDTPFNCMNLNLVVPWTWNENLGRDAAQNQIPFGCDGQGSTARIVS